MTSAKKDFGYTNKIAWIDLTTKSIRIEDADPALYADFIGGRGVQAKLIADHIKKVGPIKDPLGSQNRIIIGNAAPNDTVIPTAGRGSCSFISPMTCSPESANWIPGHKPLFGLLAHSSAGGLFPNMLKRAGFDHLIIDGRSENPVRIEVIDGEIKIVAAEDDLFEEVEGQRTLRKTSDITDFLSNKIKGASTMATGPAGWNLVAFACLTGDHHRNFGRGGAGAVFGSKNLVAISARGKREISYAYPDDFKRLSQELDYLIRASVEDPKRTASFRPTTGTTWWLDRAFNGGYLGVKGGYLPWHNFDEGYFNPEDYAKVSTEAFLGISGKHAVCNKCRHIFCTRTASVDHGQFAGSGVRPEFETIALWINCCLLNREAIFHLNRLCNELGVDTMTFGSVMAAAMEMTEKGLLQLFGSQLRFGDHQAMIKTLFEVAYGTTELGRLLANHTDRMIAEMINRLGPQAIDDIVGSVTTAFGGLGYAGINPKAFPGMFAAYSTSNRGRGDHTYAWTIQAEEAGLSGAAELATYVAEGQTGKALVDSLGLCDFFTADVMSEPFLSLYKALTGLEYSAETLKGCGRRIYTLERAVNNIQGRDRNYDAYIPPKFLAPLSSGAHAGKAVNPELHKSILDAYYSYWGWLNSGLVKST